MKILINTDQIYLHGGIEKVMATKVNYWANIPNVEVFIVTTEQDNNAPCYPIDSRVRLIDLEINYDRSKSYFSKDNIKKAILHFQKQKALLKELKPDAIISPNFNFDHYWLPFIKGNSKLIKERHGSRYAEEGQRTGKSIFAKLKFLFNDWIDSRYNHIVVLNETEKKYLKSNNGVVIPNPIEESNFQADYNSKQVIAAGRISPVKGFDHLIKAWALLPKDLKDWQLHIYGQDYLGTQAKLQKEINQHGLKHQIIFKGSVTEMTKTMADYSIYAMSSETECFPMVLLEAMSVGLPIVSYDCPNGPRHIITNNEDGVLVKHQNPEDLALKLQLIMQNHTLREQMGFKAKENSQRFSTKDLMGQWQTLLHLPNV